MILKMRSCEKIQALIDASELKPLSFIDHGKILLHTSMCANCREYYNRHNILSKIITSKPNERRNGYQAEAIHKSNSMRNRLASFPEQNPSPILEIEKSGKVSYQNPAFFHHFPHITEISVEHDFLKDLRVIFNDLVNGRIKEFSKEIYYNGVHYVKRATYLSDLQVVRVFYLDITEQKKFEKIISEKNKEITDSIQYAKRIQEALLPSSSTFKSKFPESFVFYKPKDIVAGDFYWLLEIDNWIYVAAADCTGHGVPGALVSVVCNNALNGSVKEFGCRETGQILDKTRELVLETFTNNAADVKDGMDISLAGFNLSTGELFWSGANNPLWYCSNGVINEIKAHKQPIGKADGPRPFKTHTISLQKGDYLFLFTDGYADQFGGEKGKKFKYKQMQELLLANVNLPAEEIKNILNKTFCDWKGDLAQTDDILIIGIKY